MDSILGIPSKTYDTINDFGMNVYVLGLLVLVIVVYYMFFSKLVHDVTTGEKKIYARVLEIALWAVFIVLILLNGLQYFFNINFTTEFSSLFSSNPKLNLKVKDMDNYDRDAETGPGDSIASKARGGGKYAKSSSKDAKKSKEVGSAGATEFTETELTETKTKTDASQTKPASPSPSSTKENGGVKMSGKTGVFHLPANKYTYEDSKQVCKAYGARLATYNEVEKAYAEGGDWCSYGWTDSQMVLYPTQKERWEKLQAIEGHENDCGRPGVNGGYIANPNAKFGINCYGDRPEASAEDKKRMENTVIYPKTADEIQFEKDVKKWKKQLGTLEVAPFSPTQWDP